MYFENKSLQFLRGSLEKYFYSGDILSRNEVHHAWTFCPHRMKFSCRRKSVKLLLQSEDYPQLAIPNIPPS